MRLNVDRKALRVNPDLKRVIARFFFTTEERAKGIIRKVMEMNDEEVNATLYAILREFSNKHRSITKIFQRHCKKLRYIFTQLNINVENLSEARRLLIGAYFTNEYSIESAALFSPAIVEDIDQSELEEGQKRVIMSFRGVGEGHISSIVFRRGIIDKDNEISLISRGRYIEEAELIRDTIYEKHTFFKKVKVVQLEKQLVKILLQRLKDEFDYRELKSTIRRLQEEYDDNEDLKNQLEQVLWLADSYYEIQFSKDTDISDRVIFPYTELEKKGMEDARFVKFTEDDGSFVYYATYTAYDGTNIMPMLLRTKDFYSFKSMPLYGEGAFNKNLALFPRKINGKYVMISRIDGINNYIMFSRNINVWEDPIKLQQPMYPWEFIQIGNCGSPVETKSGWLLITHGVGPMRKYCLGASLFDLEDPTIELGRLKEPLLLPNQNERSGYVPNVVYSCGSMVHNGSLIIPYTISDYASTFVTVPLNELIDKVLKGE